MGVLDGLRVVEMAGLGPVPFAAMMLADMGASVVRINPPHQAESIHGQTGPLWRGREAITLDLKREADREKAVTLAGRADVLLEGFRPGVMERLGLGPEVLCERNGRLVYARATGWGQHGEWAHAAGHDINYLAASGVLRHIAREGEPPLPPLNLVGDYGGGGMLLVVGVLGALHERNRSGRGQVVDAAMADGATLLMTSIIGRMNDGEWREPPGTNLIDTGAPFYDVYRTSDDRYLAVGAIEPVFYQRFVKALGLDATQLPDQMDRRAWPELKKVFGDVIRTESLATWQQLFAEVDACVTPVLTVHEAADAPHFRERHLLTRGPDGGLHPAPAPRFDRTPSAASGAPGSAVVDMPAWTDVDAAGP